VIFIKISDSHLLYLFKVKIEHFAKKNYGRACHHRLKEKNLSGFTRRLIVWACPPVFLEGLLTFLQINLHFQNAN